VLVKEALLRRNGFRLFLGALFCGALLTAACGGRDAGSSNSNSSTSSSTAEAPRATATSAPQAKSSIEQVALTADFKTATGAGEPDPAKLGTKFDQGAQIHALVKLGEEPGTRVSKSAWVVMDLRHKGVVVEHWAKAANYGLWTEQNFTLELGCSGGICTYDLPSGDYDLNVSLAGTKDTKAVKFSVADKDPQAASKFPKLGDAGLVQNWSAKTSPDPTKVYGTSWKATDGNLAAVYKLTPDSYTPVWTSTTLTQNGKQMGEAVTGIVTGKDQLNPWNGWVFDYLPDVKQAAGDYEVKVTILHTGESKTLKLHLDAADFGKAKLGKMAVGNQPVPRDVAPDPKTFPDKLDGFDTIQAIFELTGEVADTDTVVTEWLYGGTVIRQKTFGGASFKRNRLNGGWGNPDSLSVDKDKRNNASLPLPAGDYELRITENPAGETKSMKFNVGYAAGAGPTPVVVPTKAPATATKTP
jgi:hypothetical protein